ncbi:amino acid deaminase [Massilia arenosa]|uniref:Amino acid deaminase n=1 Tax=Zemynaea arenosa TaxID=2561931 RepID=A0A4Y9SWU1_9BURK|nr:amino acid deaminase [Massilia arenosa]TFW29987.1 amino acid deaminase [Massilia arenosa]
MSRLPTGNLRLDDFDRQLLQPGAKGLPLTAPVPQADVAAQNWNILDASVSYPVAVLRASALEHNLDWMRRFCAHFGVQLAPHGKTTMSPQLFGAQLANGAWGLTLANVPQTQVAYRIGVRRVIIANQVVAPADLAALATLMGSDPSFECWVLADSEEGVARLAAAFAGLDRPLPVLIELGLPGKRAGCRTQEEALAVSRALQSAPALRLAGVEGYEGLTDAAGVPAFVDRMLALLRELDARGAFGEDEVIISAGGSAYFDLVARGLAHGAGLTRAVLPILRSGCYLTRDHCHYFDAIAELDARTPVLDGPGLQPALEVWSMVQSTPEPGLAILTMGKRDASYDMDLPLPLYWHRPGAGGAGPTSVQGWEIFKMNDQHAYLRLPPGAEVRVGDLIGCGISHPCTTFDKWQHLLLVDDSYHVTGIVNTVF